ncbi:MAG: hypothetical protein WD739_11410 [Actinomycetota bacterium]
MAESDERLAFDVLLSEKTLELTDDLADLAVVRLATSPDELLTDLGERAMREANADYRYRFHHFLTEPREDGRRYEAPYPRALVHPNGVYWWPQYPLVGVAVSDVERAVAAHTFDGDPHALLVANVTSANGVIPEGWDQLLEVLEEIGAAYGGLLAVRKATAWLHDTITRHRPQWESRNGTARNVLSTVMTRSEWRPLELSQRLVIPEAEAARFLGALGYEDDGGGWYRLAATPDNLVLRREIQERFIGEDPQLADLEAFVSLQRRLRQKRSVD